MTYGSECPTTKKKESDKLAVTEMRMLRRIEGVTRMDRKRNEDIMKALDVEAIDECLRTNRLRWFGHVYRRENDDILKEMYNYEANRQRKRERPRTTWKRLLEEDLKKRELHKEMAIDRTEWRRHLKATPNRDSASSR